jgi:hypothetical protein
LFAFSRTLRPAHLRSIFQTANVPARRACVVLGQRGRVGWAAVQASGACFLFHGRWVVHSGQKDCRGGLSLLNSVLFYELCVWRNLSSPLVPRFGR